ncbi:MAG: protein phosphatase 2C domain-containing protein [Propionibacteriaceae bacterium]|nr:protein phosphatase 2C domain-containing protein [Propionibacteriaceae bacterium]
MGLSVAAGSDVGRVRTHNEDSFVVGTSIWAVADGMGGQAAGDKASAIAASCIKKYDQAGLVDQETVTAMIAAIQEEIMAYGNSHPKAAGLGTTVAGLALVELAGNTHWLVFHIGDSRVYRLDSDHLVCETADHSEVQILIDKGQITATEARTHPQRNVLTRCLGSTQTPKAEIRLIPYIPGDRLLICSDGLTSEIEDGKIEEVLLSSTDPHGAVNSLVDAALNAGGRDNVTVVVIDIDRLTGSAHESALEDTLSLRGIEVAL